MWEPEPYQLNDTLNARVNENKIFLTTFDTKMKTSLWRENELVVLDDNATVCDNSEQVEMVKHFLEHLFLL